ncbi:MAG: radical SAM protein [Bacillota bacterium]|nr:radical SAM protein [Bacillota bacterium]
MSLTIHQLESFGTLDGPGLRGVIFLSGCHKRCRYCHNADSWQISGGETWLENEIYNWIMRNRNYYLKNGGITFSGGEPLLQAKALERLCRRLKKEGFHIAIDTAGVIMDQDVENLLKLVDLVILDIKHVDPDTFLWLTGEKMEITMNFIEILNELKMEYWIRQVIVEGINDTIPEIEKLEKLTYSRYRSKIELIPHHNMGRHKWPTGCSVKRLEAVETSEEIMERLNQALLFFSKKDKTNETISRPMEI